jgi:hypothetical protein
MAGPVPAIPPHCDRERGGYALTATEGEKPQRLFFQIAPRAGPFSRTGPFDWRDCAAH